MVSTGNRKKSRYSATFLLLVLLIAPLLSVSGMVHEASAATVVTQKWNRTGLPSNYEGGMIVGDVDDDGYEDVVYSGKGGIYVLSGATGATKFSYLDSRIGAYCQPQLYDIDGDGRLEILVPLFYRAGIMILKVNSQNTSLYKVWEATVQGGSGSCMSKPAAADIDGNGKMRIYLGCQDVEPAGGYHGTLTGFYYNGTQFAQTWNWRVCGGGITIADPDHSGQFCIYAGDRSDSLGDGDYGKGVRCFWAKNLTLRWQHPDILCSSQAPILADVYNNGLLEVVVGDQRQGIYVLNSTTGAVMKNGAGRGLPNHYQITVSELYGNGTLYALMNDGDHAKANGGGSPNEMYVFNLASWKVVKVIRLGGTSTAPWTNRCSPVIANIYSNGVNTDGSPKMEIVVGANTTRLNSAGNRTYPASLLIFDNSFKLLQNVSGLTAQIGFPVVQDIDRDGKLEVVITHSVGRVAAYDTTMSNPAQRIRSEVSYYSELRQNVAEYVPTPWDFYQGPVVSPNYPGNDLLGVSTSLKSLSFRLSDHQGDPMSWTVTSSPNIGSGSGNNVHDGVYSVPVSGLQPYTKYTWTISVNDGTHQTKRTYSFRTAFGSPTGSAPTQGTPSLASQGGGNLAASTFAARNQSTSDTNKDRVANLYKWYVNGVSIANVIMPFNTRTDTTVTDYSGYGNQGVVHGATWTSSGRVGGAFSFDGKNDYITISDGGKGYYNNQTSNPGYPAYHASLGGDGRWTQITLEQWVYLSANTGTLGGIRIISKMPSYEIGFQQGKNNQLYGRIWVWLGDNTTASPSETYSEEYTVNYNTALSINAWHHVVFTYKSGDRLRLFVDGVQVAYSSVITGRIERSSGEPVYIGGGMGGYFNGRIDEVKIYPYALSKLQVANFYQVSKSGGSSSSLLIPSSVGAKTGSTLQCQVIPSDSQRDGQAKSSASITLT